MDVIPFLRLLTITGYAMIIRYEHAKKEVQQIKDALDAGAKTVHILDCQVAGTTYRDLADAALSLHTNDIMILKREPDNEYDPMAVMVISANGNVMGYVPREKNEVPAHILDQSQVVFAKVRDKEWQGKWLNLGIRLYLLLP